MANYFRHDRISKGIKKLNNVKKQFIQHHHTNPKFHYQESLTYKNGLKLRSYQVEGLNWLAFNYTMNRGCILADEMGLGKTRQTVAFCNHVIDYHKNCCNEKVSCLIVAPLSTLGHWKNEFETDGIECLFVL